MPAKQFHYCVCVCLGGAGCTPGAKGDGWSYPTQIQINPKRLLVQGKHSILLTQADPWKVIKGFLDSCHLGREALAALVTIASGRD